MQEAVWGVVKDAWPGEEALTGYEMMLMLLLFLSSLLFLLLLLFACCMVENVVLGVGQGKLRRVCCSHFSSESKAAL